MEPFAWIVLAFFGSLAAALCGLYALVARPFRQMQASGRLYAVIGAGLNLVTWAVNLWAAPGTNIPGRVYREAAVLSVPCVLGLVVYPWFRPRQGRGFEVTRPPRGGPGAV
jgi:hypothetical protein